jgi:hypothetical protein
MLVAGSSILLRIMWQELKADMKETVEDLKNKK